MSEIPAYNKSVALIAQGIQSLNRRNNQVALILSAIFASVWCFWTFLVLSIVPLVIPSTMPYIQLISSGILQLIALPLLAYTGNQSTLLLINLLQETHDITMQSFQLLHERHDSLQAMIDKINLSIQSDSPAVEEPSCTTSQSEV